MRYGIIKNGAIVGVRQLPADSPSLNLYKQTETLIPIEDDVTEQTHYVDSSGTVQKIPANTQPTSNHVWEASSGSWVLDTEGAWKDIVASRNRLLDETDYLMLPDYPISPACRAKIQEYRQTLRDIPQTCSDPLQIVWPTKPEVKTLA